MQCCPGCVQLEAKLLVTEAVQAAEQDLLRDVSSSVSGPRFHPLLTHCSGPVCMSQRYVKRTFNDLLCVCVTMRTYGGV